MTNVTGLCGMKSNLDAIGKKKSKLKQHCITKESKNTQYLFVRRQSKNLIKLLFKGTTSTSFSKNVFKHSEDLG